MKGSDPAYPGTFIQDAQGQYIASHDIGMYRGMTIRQRFALEFAVKLVAQSSVDSDPFLPVPGAAIQIAVDAVFLADHLIEELNKE